MRSHTGASCWWEIACLLVVMCSVGVRGLRCLSCNKDERIECATGADAIKYDKFVVDCTSFCEVQQQLLVKSDGTTSVGNVVRGCVDKMHTSCTNRTRAPLRDCVATCSSDLCNVFDNVVERVENPDKFGDDDAGGLVWYYWLLIALAVVVTLAVVGVVGLRVKRQRGSRSVYK